MPKTVTSQKKHTVIPAVYVLLRRRDELFLLRRKNTGYRDGDYVCPSGHIEAGEGALMAGVREVKEEVGVDIALQDLRLVHVHHNLAEERDHERISFFFEATKWHGEPHNAEPHKSDGTDWFKLDTLPAN